MHIFDTIEIVGRVVYRGALTLSRGRINSKKTVTEYHSLVGLCIVE